MQGLMPEGHQPGCRHAGPKLGDTGDEGKASPLQAEPRMAYGRQLAEFSG